MKKILSILIILLLCGTLTAILVGCDEDFHICESSDLDYKCDTCGASIGIITYTKIEGGYEVSGYVGEPTNVIIPIQYKGKPVISIQENAFLNCSSIISVFVPETVTSIGDRAFYGCKNLTIYLRANGLDVWEYEWNGNAPVVFGVSGIVEKDGFVYALKGKQAMVGGYCGTETNVVIPATISEKGLIYTVTEIGAQAFRYRPDLTSVFVPETVLAVGRAAFIGCENVTVYCEADSKSSGWSQSWNYDKRPVAWGATATIEKDGLRYGVKDGKATVAGYNGTKTDVVIPSTVSENGVTYTVSRIGENVFRDDTNLTSVAIPDSVTDIGTYAFYGCSNLTICCETKTQPLGWDDSWQYNNRSVLWGVAALFEEEGLTYGIRDGNATVFGYVGTKTDVVIPSSVSLDGTDYAVTSIYQNAFKECTHITSVTMPDSMITVGNYAFRGCRSLTLVFIPQSVRVVGIDAFASCIRADFYCGAESKPSGWDSSWSTSTYGLIVWDIDFAFKQEGFVYAIQDGEAKVSRYNGKSTRIAIPATVSYNETTYAVTGILDRAFEDRAQLISVDIPDSVSSIGAAAFEGCYSLASIFISDSVTDVGRKAFSRCSRLTVYCEVESNPSEWDSDWDSGWDSTSIPVVWGATAVFTKDGFVYGIKDGKATVEGYYAKAAQIAVPSSVSENEETYIVVKVGDSAFNQNTSLTSITLPDSLTSIGDRTFEGCYNLASINLPDGLTSIGAYAFYGCDMTSVTLPEGLTSIGTRAFSLCEMTSITLPGSLTSIGEQVFYGCYDLTTINLPNSMTSIGDRVFEGCHDLTTINLPDGLISIGERAFADCYRLASITLPDGLISIGAYAFYDCRINLIVIPESVTSVGKGVFYSCGAYIFCEAESQPSGWDSDWNGENRPVCWAGEWTYDGNENPVPLEIGGVRQRRTNQKTA